MPLPLYCSVLAQLECYVYQFVGIFNIYKLNLINYHVIHYAHWYHRNATWFTYLHATDHILPISPPMTVDICVFYRYSQLPSKYIALTSSHFLGTSISTTAFENRQLYAFLPCFWFPTYTCLALVLDFCWLRFYMDFDSNWCPYLVSSKIMYPGLQIGALTLTLLSGMLSAGFANIWVLFC